ncbi:MAG: RNA polymerase sigma factor [Ktedonobacteraceae bacterium]|nr:RNA polymerase sigma factor [Chloroflexota bacterium]
MRQDDSDLVTLLASDLDRHFAQLLLRYQHRLYAFVARQAGSSQEAEDIVQEAFMQAYFALARYGPQQVRELVLRPWLFKIALNIFYGRMRKVRLPCVSLDLSQDGSHLAIEDDAASQPEVIAEGREAQRELEALVSTLPEQYRAVVNLYYFEGLSYQEIADLLTMPMGSVKSHLYRGIRRLRALLVTQQQERR